jgi:hypothetical protein
MKQFIITGIIICSILTGCSSKKAEEVSKADTVAFEPPPPVSSSAAVVNTKDSTHKFVRTADLKFRTQNVIKTTYAIEGIIDRMNGFVTSTELRSEVNSISSKRLNADSLVETTHFTVINEMIIRVPNTRLDTTLKAIAKYIDFLDSRTIKADDVSLQLMSNNMTAKRNQTHVQRLTNDIDNKGKKLGETADAEENLSFRMEKADNARMANLTLKEMLAYSTITLTIYQRPDIRVEHTLNTEISNDYQPGIGSDIADALHSGWLLLRAIISFLIGLWPLILFGTVIYIVFIRIKKKPTNKQQ